MCFENSSTQATFVYPLFRGICLRLFPIALCGLNLKASESGWGNAGDMPANLVSTNWQRASNERLLGPFGLNKLTSLQYGTFSPFSKEGGHKWDLRSRYEEGLIFLMGYHTVAFELRSLSRSIYGRVVGLIETEKQFRNVGSVYVYLRGDSYTYTIWLEPYSPHCIEKLEKVDAISNIPTRHNNIEGQWIDGEPHAYIDTKGTPRGEGNGQPCGLISIGQLQDSACRWDSERRPRMVSTFTGESGSFPGNWNCCVLGNAWSTQGRTQINVLEGGLVQNLAHPLDELKKLIKPEPIRRVVV
ncbi:hypothetical protein BKA70DRAFT_1236744 [Coprinopsis sp. MPI-PUGE-AT-0042]|nr:hypothetical protein BKA70DRAFT_1236744 [Coprinopsis sp. MPI-PUGE-AT-0042]